MDRFLNVQDVMEILGVARSRAYQIIHQLNAELEEHGYMTIAGRVHPEYFNERFGIKGDKPL